MQPAGLKQCFSLSKPKLNPQICFRTLPPSHQLFAMQKGNQPLYHSHFHSSARAQCTRTYLLLFFSLMWSLVSRICPFLSHVIWGGGSPWATHVKMAVVPTGLEMDWGCCTNSAGAERRKEKEGEKSHDDPTLSWYKKTTL